jgi:hypothetical protein
MRPFEEVECVCDRRSAHAQHPADILVNEADLITVDTVVAHEQPAREALLGTISKIGCESACGLHRQGMDVSQENRMSVRTLAAEIMQLES